MANTSKMIAGLKKKLFNNKNNIVLHNKYVLYLLNLIALVVLFHLLLLRDIYHTILFFLIGFLTQFFCKNMIVILFTAILCTSIIKYGINMNVEGMDGTETDAMEPDENTGNTENTMAEPSGENYMENTNTNTNENEKKEKKNQA
jgi:hypothetical protein